MVLHPIEAGSFKLDGGAMFGVVPKSLWQKTNPSDSNNMIDMSARCLLVENGNKLILIDTGMGDKQSEKFFSYYYRWGNDSLVKSINDAGFSWMGKNIEEGNMHVTKIERKKFVAKNIIHAAVFRKKDSRTVYNMIYKDGKTGTSYMKRFNVTGVTRDKTYNLTSSSPKTKVLYFSSNPNGEAEVVTIQLRQSGSIKKLKWDLDFGDLTIKGRSVKGNIVTKHSVNKVLFKEKGLSTLKPRKIWFDETVSRINVENRGDLLGEFKPHDDLLIVSSSGILKILSPDLSMHFPDDMIILEKADRSKPISVVYFNTKKNIYFIKRFVLGVLKGEQKYVDISRNIQVELVSTDWKPVIELVVKNGKELTRDKVNVFDFISVKGIKAIGNQLSKKQLKEINLLDPIPYEPEIKELNEIEVVDEQDDDRDDDSNENGQSQIKLEF